MLSSTENISIAFAKCSSTLQMLSDIEKNYLITHAGTRLKKETTQFIIARKNIEHAQSYFRMLDAVHKNHERFFPLTEANVFHLHHLLMPNAANTYKTVQNEIRENNGNQSTIIYQPVEPGLLTELYMSDLITWYNQTVKTADPVLTATQLVLRFLAIHPFEDGNGRLSRALFQLSLLHSMDCSQQIISWLPIDYYFEALRHHGYRILAKTLFSQFEPDSQKYNIQPYSNFLTEILNRSLSHFQKKMTQ